MDFIDEFFAHTEGLPTPEIFRLWGAISAVGACLERRCYTETAAGALYPNLYIMLVAPPAVGKGVVMSQVVRLLRKVEKVKIAPDDATGASLVDAMVAANKTILNPDGSVFSFHALFAASFELGVLLPEYDSVMISLLCALYDNNEVYEQTRRTNNRNISIKAPTLNLLAGCTPGYLAGTFPEMAWTMGFSSRLCMIYSSTPVKVSLFRKRPFDVERETRLVDHLKKVLSLQGEFIWNDDTAAALEFWFNTDMKPVPTHSKLQTYNGRRNITIIKLCMIASAARSDSMQIEMEDYQRAQSWLLQIEALMPDIFRDMNGRSDTDVLEELHFFMWRKYCVDKKPIHEATLYHFLGTKVPSEKIPRIIEVAERMNMMHRSAGSLLWTPRGRQDHGME